MKAELLSRLLPWIVSLIGITASLFVYDDSESDERPLGNFIISFSGYISAFFAYLFLPGPSKYFIATILASGSTAAFIARTKLISLTSLSTAIFASMAWVLRDTSLALSSIAIGLLILSFIMKDNKRSLNVIITSILAILAILGSTMPIMGGTIFIALFAAWLGFFFPFATLLSSEDEKSLIIVRLTAFPLAALSISGINTYIIPLIIICFIATAVVAFSNDLKNRILYLAASSSAILFLVTYKHPAFSIIHVCAVIGAVTINTNSDLTKISKKLMLLSLAGVPLLGGFWARWLVIKMYAQDNVWIPILLCFNTFSWIYSIIYKESNPKDEPSFLISSPVITAITAACLAVIIFLGIVGI